MSDAAVAGKPRLVRSRRDPNHLGQTRGTGKARGRGTGGPAPKRIVVTYGF